MSIQSQLNNSAIAVLPKIAAIIERAEVFEANQMKYRALREINNSKIAIDSMTLVQLDEFQEDLIEVFKCRNWIM